MPDQLTPYEGTAPYVFVSFEDSELAEPIIRRLLKMGFRARFPLIVGDKVLFDKDWVKAQIEGCAVFLLLCDRQFYCASPIQWEIETATMAKKTIVRVDLEAIEDQQIPLDTRIRLAKRPHLKKYEMGEEVFYEALLTDRVLYPCHEDDTVFLFPPDDIVPRPPTLVLPPPIAPDSAQPVTKDAASVQRGARILALTADGLPKAYEGSEPYIFVSYRHIEKKQAYPIIRRLNEAGYRVWYDEGIRSGEQYWNDVVAEHVKRCTVLIALCSKAFFESEHCREELEYAKKLGHTIHWVDLSRYPEDAIPAGIAMRFNMVQKTAKYELKDDAFYEILFQGRDMDLCRYADAAPRTNVPAAAKEKAPAKAKPLLRFFHEYGVALMLLSTVLMPVLSLLTVDTPLLIPARLLCAGGLAPGCIDTVRMLFAHAGQLRLGKRLLVSLLTFLCIFLLAFVFIFTLLEPVLPTAAVAVGASLCMFLAVTVRMLCGN